MEKRYLHEVVRTPNGVGTIVHIYPDATAYVVELPDNKVETFKPDELTSTVNERLETGNRVELLSTDDAHGIPVGTKGTVISKSEVGGLMIYGMMWDNGRTLNLVEGGDNWMKLPA